MILIDEIYFSLLEAKLYCINNQLMNVIYLRKNSNSTPAFHR